MRPGEAPQNLVAGHVGPQGGVFVPNEALSARPGEAPKNLGLGTTVLTAGSGYPWSPHPMVIVPWQFWLKAVFVSKPSRK